jgi:3-dehydroquinate synthase
MIAMEMDRIPRSTAQRIIDLVLAYGPLPKVDVRPKEIFRRLGSDKKTLDGLIHFVLPSDVGKVEIVTDVREEVVMRVVEELRGLPQG